MCFSPHVSLATAVIEFVLGSIILFKYRKSLVAFFSSIMVFLLGTYQFTEFMVCTSGDPILWSSVGFATYTLLPVLALHFMIRLTGEKVYAPFLYLPAIYYGLMPLLTKSFILSASCHTVFISVQNTLFVTRGVGFFLYNVYYFGYLILACYLLWKKYKIEKNKKQQDLYVLLFAAIIVMTLPPVFLFLVFPAFKIVFPSLYCEFAVLFAIMAFAAVIMDSTSSRNVRRRKRA
ncbi:MAG: histidine kinase N-terminal 7TM domain-containing protein [Candidatus Nanoarchaeia archaeon]